MKTDKGKGFTLMLPPISLIVVFAALCAILKLLTDVSWNWIITLLVLPITLYFYWCIGVMTLSLMYVLMTRLHNKLKFDSNKKGK